jgi:Fur family transcriptional regulator, ferric uptake regulator
LSASFRRCGEPACGRHDASYLAARPGARLVAGTGEFRSAQQLHAGLRDRGAAVGVTTVYRTLQLLADAGEVDQMRLPGGEQLYRRCSHTRHHHHLVCRSCGATVEVEDPVIERWARAQAAGHGLTDVSHTLEIFGCAPPAPHADRPPSRPAARSGPRACLTAAIP